MRKDFMEILSNITSAAEYGAEVLKKLLEDQETQHQYTLTLLERGRTDTVDNHIFAYLNSDSVQNDRKKEVLAAMIQHDGFRERVFFWGKEFLSDEKVSAADKVEIAIFAITKGVIYQGVGLFNDKMISIEDKSNIFMALWEGILKKPYFPSEQAELLINRYSSIPNVGMKNKQKVMRLYLSSRFCNFKSALFKAQFKALNIKQKCALLRWLGDNHDFEKNDAGSYHSLVHMLSHLVTPGHYNYDDRTAIWGTMVAIDQRLSPKIDEPSRSDEMERLHSDERISRYDSAIFNEYGYKRNMHPMNILGGINAIRLQSLGACHQLDDQSNGIVIKSSSGAGKSIKYREVHVKRLLAYAIQCLWTPSNTTESSKDILDQYLTQIPQMMEDKDKINELKKMLEKCPYLIVLVPEAHPLRNDLSFMKKMLKDNGEILAFLSRSQRNDRTLVQVATSKNDKAWSYVGENRMEALLFHTPKFLKSPACEKAYYSLTDDEQLQYSYIVQMLKSGCNHQDLLNHLGVLIAQKYSLIKNELFPGLDDQEIENRIKDIRYETLGKVLLGYFVGLVPDLSTPDPEWRKKIRDYGKITIESFANTLIWHHDRMKVEDGMRFFPTSLKDQASVTQSEIPIPTEKITDFLTQKEKLKFEEARLLAEEEQEKSEKKSEKDSGRPKLRG